MVLERDLGRPGRFSQIDVGKRREMLLEGGSFFRHVFVPFRREGDGSPQLEAMDKNLVNTGVRNDGLGKDSGAVFGTWSTGNRTGTRKYAGAIPGV